MKKNVIIVSLVLILVVATFTAMYFQKRLVQEEMQQEIDKLEIYWEIEVIEFQDLLEFDVYYKVINGNLTEVHLVTSGILHVKGITVHVIKTARLLLEINNETIDLSNNVHVTFLVDVIVEQDILVGYIFLKG